MQASARWRAWRTTAASASPPACGCLVGRAFSPAAWCLRHRRVCGTMQASSPTDTGQGPARLYRIFPPPTGNAPLRLRLAAQTPPLIGEALGGPRLPCKGSCRRQPTEGCGALPRQYPSGPPRGPRRAKTPALQCKAYGRHNRGRQARQVDDSRGVSPLCVGADACIGPSAGLADNCRFRIAARLRVPCRAGDFARRGALRHRGFPGRCKHRPLRNIGQGRAGLCRIPVGQSGNAPLRLRLTAHPPSGLRCPHRTARAEARLCSATVKPAPSRFLRRRRRSTSQPLAGEAL